MPETRREKQPDGSFLEVTTAAQCSSGTGQDAKGRWKPKDQKVYLDATTPEEFALLKKLHVLYGRAAQEACDELNGEAHE